MGQVELDSSKLENAQNLGEQGIPECRPFWYASNPLKSPEAKLSTEWTYMLRRITQAGDTAK